MKLEINELCGNFKPPKKLQYYLDIAEMSFDFVEKYPNNSDIVHSAYITFLSGVIYCYET